MNVKLCTATLNSIYIKHFPPVEFYRDEFARVCALSHQLVLFAAGSLADLTWGLPGFLSLLPAAGSSNNDNDGK